MSFTEFVVGFVAFFLGLIFGFAVAGLCAAAKRDSQNEPFTAPPQNK